MQASKKKKLCTSIGFLACLLVVVTILNMIFQPTRLNMVDYVTERDNYYLSLMEEPENTVDILAMGDSLSYGMIDPVAFFEKEGLTSHIVGQAGQVVPETFFELKRLLDKQSPKLVILETHILVYTTADEFNATEQQLFYAALPAAKYHELWKVMLGKREESAHKHFKGYEIRDAVAPYTGGPYMENVGQTRNVRFLSAFFLKKIKGLCDEAGAGLLLVSLPSPSNYSYATHCGLSELAEELSLPYIDMNLMTDELEFDWNTDMLDSTDHINNRGTDKVSAYLLDYVKKNYDIKSRAEDESVRAWYEQAEEFKEYFGIP